MNQPASPTEDNPFRIAPPNQGEPSQSLFTILHPSTNTNNPLPSQITTQHQQSAVIDIDKNQGAPTMDDENDNSTESSSNSPSPSLTTHHHPSEPDQIRLSRTNSSHPHQQLKRSILHDHRPNPASSLSLDYLQNQPSPTDPFNLLSKFKSIYSQGRVSLPSNQSNQTNNPLNSFSHHQQNQTPRPEPPGPRIDRQLNSKEMALWRWVNVDDLDSFLQDVYSYYVGNGIWAIGLSRLCNLMTVGFVIGFSIFLLGCIDYSVLRSSHHLHEVIVPQCVSRFSGLTLLLVLGFSGYYSWRVLKFGQEISNLWKMHEFFTELLEVTEADIQTIPWYKLVDQLAKLKHQHPTTIAVGEGDRTRKIDTQSVLQRKLDAHDVATQIMREQNYLIALFNRDILDLTPPLPSWMIGNALVAERHLSTSLEWNLVYCIRGFILDHHGQVKPEFLVSRLDPSLAAGLQRRFKVLAIINFIFGPFIVVYVLIYSFFRYFEEYHKNPSSIGSRSFTRLAQWKFREYNELPHLFQERLAKSYLTSKQYIDHFPKIKMTILAKFVSFIAGSFAGVLIVLSLYDPDAFLHFEITKERSVIFYIGLFGSILAISRGMIQQEYDEKIERPGELMEKIVRLTHYLPNHWYGKLHGLEVFNEFGQMFQLKLIIFLHEIMSILLTPYIFWNNFNLDRCQRIIEFFREFTIHVDGIGYVCSFSVFDFNKLEIGQFSGGPNLNQDQVPNPMEGGGGPIRLNENQPMMHNNNRHTRQTNDINKLERSILNFVSHHPNWEPSTQTGSLYLSKAMGGYPMEADTSSQPTPSTSNSIHHNHYTHHPYHQNNLSLGASASPIRQRLAHPHNQFVRNTFASSSNPRPSFGFQNSTVGESGINSGLAVGSSRPIGSIIHHQNARSSQPGSLNINRNNRHSPNSMGSSNTLGGITTKAGKKGNNNHTNSSSSSIMLSNNKRIGTDYYHYHRGNKSSSLMGVEAIDEEDDNKLLCNSKNNSLDDNQVHSSSQTTKLPPPTSLSSSSFSHGSPHPPNDDNSSLKNSTLPLSNLASSSSSNLLHSKLVDDNDDDDDVDPFKA